MRDWSTYIANTRDKTATPILAEAFLYAKNRNKALDFGCGAMSDVDALAEAGFKEIDAVDSCVDIQNIAVEKRASGMPVTFYKISFNEFTFKKNTYDFINAQNAIPFAGPEHIEEVMEGIKHSMKPEGVFVGTFFGPDDAWADKLDVAIYTRESIAAFFGAKEWRVHKFEEERAVRPTASGKEKKWHVFHVIAVRTDTM